jgi:hypothetical protein
VVNFLGMVVQFEHLAGCVLRTEGEIPQVRCDALHGRAHGQGRPLDLYRGDILLAEEVGGAGSARLQVGQGALELAQVAMHVGVTCRLALCLLQDLAQLSRLRLLVRQCALQFRRPAFPLAQGSLQFQDCLTIIE